MDIMISVVNGKVLLTLATEFNMNGNMADILRKDYREKRYA